MTRNVRIILLYEDRQHETFMRRFLKKASWNLRDLTLIPSPVGRGSAEQFVRREFPRQLRAVRSRRGEQKYLVVMVDGDASGVARRNASLKAACEEQGVPPPDDADNVLICVPTWKIETWLAYLKGETVDETNKSYDKLSRPRECQPTVDELVVMCRERTLRPPAPASLEDTCTNYRRVFDE